MSVNIEKISDNHLLGESPHWDVKTQNVYFVDILGKAIHKYNPTTKKLVTAPTEERVSFIIPVEGKPNEFVITQTKKLVHISWDGESDKFNVLDTILEVETDGTKPNNTFNDGKCDASGRLWAGTMSSVREESGHPKVGSLYSISKNRSVKPHLSDLRVSNGLTWNTTNDKMYYIDSSKGTVDQLDFDLQNGAVSNLQSIFTLSKHGLGGFPDGMTIDSDGNLWVALFNGSKVIKIDPRKPETLLQVIEMPAKQITACTFGGKNLDELYVTTARLNSPGEDELRAPVHGATYVITGTDAKGLLPFNIVL